MNKMDSFIDVVIFLAGGYMIYSAIIMKTKGEVLSSFMSKDIDWKRASEENKKAYIRIMFPANIIMGIVMMAISAVFTFGERMGLTGTAESILIAIALLICIAYGAVLMNYQNKYLSEQGCLPASCPVIHADILSYGLSALEGRTDYLAVI